jgi:hypothetical protein
MYMLKTCDAMNERLCLYGGGLQACVVRRKKQPLRSLFLFATCKPVSNALLHVQLSSTAFRVARQRCLAVRFAPYCVSLPGGSRCCSLPHPTGCAAAGAWAQ